MSIVDTWSIWMATLSFIRSISASRQSVKPPAQFLQPCRRPAAQLMVARVTDGGEESLEGADGSAPVVEPGIDLARLEQQLRLVGRHRQHALQRTRRALPVLALGKPEADVVLEPQQHVAIGHRIEVGRVELGLRPRHPMHEVTQLGGIAYRAIVKRIDDVAGALDGDPDQKVAGKVQTL